MTPTNKVRNISPILFQSKATHLEPRIFRNIPLYDTSNMRNLNATIEYLILKAWVRWELYCTTLFHHVLVIAIT